MKLSFRKLGYLQQRLLAATTGRINLHFLHIRKTGGTALKNALRGTPVTPNCVLHLHPHRIGLTKIPEGHRVMFATRDPVDRFISGFGSRQRQGAPANHIPWSEAEAKAFARFPAVNELAAALNPAHPRHAEAKEAMTAIGHLNNAYRHWFGSPALVRKRLGALFFIARIESFEGDFLALKSAIRLPDTVCLPSDPKRAHRTTGVNKPTLSDEETRWVKAWYAEDYEFLDIFDQWRTAQGGPVARDILSA